MDFAEAYHDRGKRIPQDGLAGGRPVRAEFCAERDCSRSDPVPWAAGLVLDKEENGSRSSESGAEHTA